MTLTEQHQKLIKAARFALKLLDINDCDSGGDYHSSAVGRHAGSKDGGKSKCPACQLREALIDSYPAKEDDT